MAYPKRSIILAVCLCVFAMAIPSAVEATDNDIILRKTISAYDLRPLPTKPYEETKKYLLGQALFFDSILSGNRDVSCATCHLLRRGTSDALPRSIGVGRLGLGEGRRLDGAVIEHPRNSLDLWNRDNNAVKTLFWDGRVEALDPKERTFRSPLSDSLPSGMENVLAVQALFPLARSDEMLGEPGDRSSSDLPLEHADQPNELAGSTIDKQGVQRITAVHDAIIERLLGQTADELADWQRKYRRLFRVAYPGKEIAEMTIADLANAIAHFEEIAFATRNTAWDRYVAGDLNAIPDRAKSGAIIFFGKGRCAVCHAGPLFSDFEFHSLAVRQRDPETGVGQDDLGRYDVTKDFTDLYKFRTPPLRNVTLTSPYFHNGTAMTLSEAIGHHQNPLAIADQYDETGAVKLNIDQINSVDFVLRRGIDISESDVRELIEFLKTLEDYPSELEDDIIPHSVPSGLPVTAIPSGG